MTNFSDSLRSLCLALVVLACGATPYAQSGIPERVTLAAMQEQSIEEAAAGSVKPAYPKGSVKIPQLDGTTSYTDKSAEAVEKAFKGFRRQGEQALATLLPGLRYVGRYHGLKTPYSADQNGFVGEADEYSIERKDFYVFQYEDDFYLAAGCGGDVELLPGHWRLLAGTYHYLPEVQSYELYGKLVTEVDEARGLNFTLTAEELKVITVIKGAGYGPSGAPEVVVYRAKSIDKSPGGRNVVSCGSKDLPTTYEAAENGLKGVQDISGEWLVPPTFTQAIYRKYEGNAIIIGLDERGEVSARSVYGKAFAYLDSQSAFDPITTPTGDTLPILLFNGRNTKIPVDMTRRPLLPFPTKISDVVAHPDGKHLLVATTGDALMQSTLVARVGVLSGNPAMIHLFSVDPIEKINSLPGYLIENSTLEKYGAVGYRDVEGELGILDIASLNLTMTSKYDDLEVVPVSEKIYAIFGREYQDWTLLLSSGAQMPASAYHEILPLTETTFLLTQEGEDYNSDIAIYNTDLKRLPGPTISSVTKLSARPNQARASYYGRGSMDETFTHLVFVSEDLEGVMDSTGTVVVPARYVGNKQLKPDVLALFNPDESLDFFNLLTNKFTFRGVQSTRYPYVMPEYKKLLFHLQNVEELGRSIYDEETFFVMTPDKRMGTFGPDGEVVYLQENWFESANDPTLMPIYRELVAEMAAELNE